jgi:hypothetical protein
VLVIDDNAETASPVAELLVAVASHARSCNRREAPYRRDRLVPLPAGSWRRSQRRVSITILVRAESAGKRCEPCAGP